MNNYFNAEYFDIMSVAAVSPRVEIANPEYNVKQIISSLETTEALRSEFVVFPELSISGYTCGDLFFQSALLQASAQAIISLVKYLKDDSRLVVVGSPLKWKGRLYNCAVVIAGGKILGAVPKINIPNYQEFYEKRYFSSGAGIENRTIDIDGIEVPFGTSIIFQHKGVKTGVEICEDLWVPTPPSSILSQCGAELIFNLSATDESTGKNNYLQQLIASQSGRCRCAYAYASAGNGESSTDLVFSGNDIIAVNGKITAASQRFSTSATIATTTVDFEALRNDRLKYSSFYSDKDLLLKENACQVISSGIEKDTNSKHLALNVNPYPFIPTTDSKDADFKEIINIQSWGLGQRLRAIGCKVAVVGISGGLDSTLALLIIHHTFRLFGLNTKDIIAVTMPAEATSSRTYKNALQLMKLLDTTILEIEIKDAVRQHFADINHDPDQLNAVYENSQARERTQILMDLANKYNGIVVGTGDLSELALGWCTYNGDHMSMYGVNAGVPKTLVKYLVRHFAEASDDAKLKETLSDIIDTPISPELIPSSKTDKEIQQQTENIIGPYVLHDFFLYHVLRNGYSPSKIFFLANTAFHGMYSRGDIKKWLINFYRRFFSQQFKRSCLPDGPKVGSVCLSPRGDWRMPSDASSKAWIKEAESLPVI